MVVGDIYINKRNGSILLDKNKTYNWVIYKIESPSGRIYIGKTNDFKTRMRRYSSSNCKAQKLVYASILKYGFKAHEVNIIDEFEGSPSDVSSKEMFWIRSFMSNNCKYPTQNGLNLTDGGEGNTGYVPSEGTREKLRQALIGKPSRNKGTVYSEETRKKMSVSGKGTKNPKKGRKWTEEHRKMMMGCRKKRVYPKGRFVSDEEKLKARLKKMAYFVPVNKYTKEGVFIKKYESISEAAKDTGCQYGQLMGHIRGLRPTCYNFIFKRA